MNRHGLRTKILFFSILPIILIGCGMAAFFSYSNYSKLNEKLINNGRSIIYPLSTNISFAMTQQNTILLQGLINEVHRDNDRSVLAISVFDSNNDMLATSSIAPETTLFKLNTDENEHIYSSDSVEYTNDGIILRMPIYAYDESSLVTLYGEKTAISNSHIARVQNELIPYADPKINYPRLIVGYVCIYFLKNQMIIDTYGDISIASILVLLCVLISLLLGINLNRIIVDPLNKLSIAIYEIREGNVNTKVNGVMFGELEKLRTYINSMANTMSEFHNEMQYSVDLATNDLRQTLDKLDLQNKELANAISKADDASKIKSEFLANMSHELRTPLNGIIGFAKQLYKSDLNKTQIDFLIPIERSATNLLSIVNNIMDFSKLDAGKLSFEEIPFSLREVCYDTVNLLSTNAYEKGLELTITINNDVHDYVYGDPLRLGQILTNLIGNAIKFTSKGNVALDISLDQNNQTSSNLNEVYLKFVVRDTGIGISDEQKERLFNPFTQADSSISRKYGGTGLGLVITKRLIEQMNGSIDLISENGNGTEFTVKLVLSKGISPIVPKNQKIKNIEHAKIALIESNTWVRDSIKNILDSWNVDTITMSNPTLLNSLANNDYPKFIIYGIRNNFDYNILFSDFSSINIDKVKKVIIAINSMDQAIHNKIKQLSSKVFIITKPIYPSKLLDLLNSSTPSIIDELPPIVEQQPQLTTKSSLIKKAILAVDDNPTNLMLIRTLLSEIVTDVYTATDGKEAIEKCLHTEFDLIFMDIQMPIMDGVTAMKAIKKNKTNSNTPIVAVTALVMKEERDRFIQEGMVDYLSKPLDETQLKSIIAKYCGESIIKNNTDKAINNKELQKSPQNTQNTINKSLWNIENTMKICANKKDLALEMMEMFIKSIPDFEKVLNNKESLPKDELAKAIHKFAGSAVYCGLPSIKEICNIIEAGLKKGDSIDDFEPEFLELFDYIEVIHKENKKWIKSIKKFK